MYNNNSTLYNNNMYNHNILGNHNRTTYYVVHTVNNLVYIPLVATPCISLLVHAR